MQARMAHGTAFLTDHSRAGLTNPLDSNATRVLIAGSRFLTCRNHGRTIPLHAFNRGLCRVQLPICQSYPGLFW